MTKREFELLKIGDIVIYEPNNISISDTSIIEVKIQEKHCSASKKFASTRYKGIVLWSANKAFFRGGEEFWMDSPFYYTLKEKYTLKETKARQKLTRLDLIDDD